MRIVAAAVRYNGVTFTIPAPARHADILRLIYQLCEAAALHCEQGFIADDGRFYDRPHAKQIVADHQQETIRSTHSAELFSEDLW